MIAPRLLECRLILLPLIAWALGAGVASAQASEEPTRTPPSLAIANARVPVGDVLYVTDTAGNTIRGKLAALTDEAVQLWIGDVARRVVGADVRRIQWQQRDSPLSGALIGAGIGAIPGIYYPVTDPNECTGLCPEEYALIAIGAVVGALIDRAITRKVTVYPAGTSSSRSTKVLIGPLATRKRTGVQLAWRF